MELKLPSTTSIDHFHSFEWSDKNEPNRLQSATNYWPFQFNRYTQNTTFAVHSPSPRTVLTTAHPGMHAHRKHLELNNSAQASCSARAVKINDY